MIMDIITPLTLFIIFAIVGIVVFYSIKNRKALSTLLADNGFLKQTETTKEVSEFVKALLSPYSIGDIYQGTERGTWNSNTWLIDVDPGGEDPTVSLLTWKQAVTNMPNFAVGRCTGVQNLNKIIKLMAGKAFKKLDLNLLPQELQPFLSRRKGLLLYSNENILLTDVINEQLFQYINNPKLNVSFVYYNGRMCCWTQGFSKLDSLFESCDFIRTILK